MTYIKVAWKHSSLTDPILLYSELDGERRETRKVEIFRDGRLGYAGSNSAFGGTQLGTMPIPPLDEINSDDQFDGHQIEEAEFQEVWEEAISR